MEPLQAVDTRVLRISRAQTKESLMFTLQSTDDGMFLVTAVVAGGPAALAGLLPDDEIIAINGVSIYDKDHDEVLGLLKATLETELIVMRDMGTKKDPKRWLECDVQLARIEEAELLGLRVAIVQDGTFYVSHVASDGLAKRAGLEEGDQIIKVDDEEILGLSHEDVINRICHGGLETILRIIRRQPQAKRKELMIAVERSEDTVPLGIGGNSFDVGIVLVISIRKDSPAFMAGLRPGDQILGVYIEDKFITPKAGFQGQFKGHLRLVFKVSREASNDPLDINSDQEDNNNNNSKIN
eukprot:m.131301 g.131301  ORF g.131301 m.131301 type:complete len:297 (-) comp14622_c1_seq2:52-942(-)